MSMWCVCRTVSELYLLLTMMKLTNNVLSELCFCMFELWRLDFGLLLPTCGQKPLNVALKGAEEKRALSAVAYLLVI